MRYPEITAPIPDSTATIFNRKRAWLAEEKVPPQHRRAGGDFGVGLEVLGVVTSTAMPHQ